MQHSGFTGTGGLEWLVDGAVVNPVSLTRALEADIVIAVDLQHDAHLTQQDLMSASSLY